MFSLYILQMASLVVVGAHTLMYLCTHVINMQCSLMPILWLSPRYQPSDINSTKSKKVWAIRDMFSCRKDFKSICNEHKVERTKHRTDGTGRHWQSSSSSSSS